MSWEIIDVIKSVPDVIWSAIVASGITFFGVMLSNRSNTNRLVLQLNHDSDEKSKERINKLRYEVYLKVAEDIEGVNISLSTLVNRDPTKLDMNVELHPITSSIAKLKLVAESNTAKLAGELSIQFGVLFLKVLPRLIPVDNAKTDIEINDSSYLTFSAEVSRLLREMQRLREEGPQDGVMLKYIQNAYEFNSVQAEKYAAARANAYDVHGKVMSEFNDWFLPEMKNLTSYQLELMVAIREELSVISDVTDLQRQLERHWAVMEAGYSDAIKDIKKE